MVGMAQFRLECFDTGETPLQIGGPGAGQFILRHTDGRVDISQSILGDDLVFRLAKDQPDSGLVGRVFEQIVHRRTVEIHFFGVFGFEVALFQVNDDETAQPKI